MCMCSGAVYGPAVYGDVLRGNIWTAVNGYVLRGNICSCINGYGIRSSMRTTVWVCAKGQYMDLQYTGMYSGAIYGPAVYGYEFRGNIWTCSIRV